METKPNPDEGDTGETHSEAETQYQEALRSPEASARSKVGPRQVGDFRLGRLLGRGGMGAVYEAYEQSMRRTVALKILDSGIDPSANEVSRFEREAWIAGRLNHPNIVKALSQGEESGIRYMAMELIDGCSLAGEIRSAKDAASRPPSDSKSQSARIRKMVTLFVSVANALQHVHENGIIHRDIKPQNLLLPKDESRLFLTDFGLARDEQASQLTRRGDFLGTIRYMSPEQLLAQRAQVDRRTDIWSLGVSLYEAVTLDVPYSGASEEAYITAISMRQPLPASARNPSVSRDLETVLMKCLERDPERRYSSAAELSADLQRFVRDEPVLARRPGLAIKLRGAVKRHRAGIRVAIVSAVLALSLLVVLVRWQRLRAEDGRIRWVLQQMISTHADPAKLDPSWEHLEQRLASRSKQNPDSDLALLANRAGIQPVFLLPSFGLISNSPELWWGLETHWPLDQRYLYLLDFEASLDGGSWAPIGSAVFKAGSASTSVTLEQLFGRLSQAPHRVVLRTTIRFLDAGAVPPQTYKQMFDSSRFRAAGPAFIRGAFQGTWPDLRKTDIVRFTETRSSETKAIDLYDRYPPEFPNRMATFPNGKTVETYFAPNRVQIIRLRLSGGSGPGIAFEWPSGPGQRTHCSSADSVPADRVAAMELSGRMDPQIPIPLAAEAELHVEGSDRALLAFPFVLGEAYSNAWWGDTFVGISTDVSTSADSNRMRFYFRGTRGAAARSDLLERLAGQTASGYLILKPSRTVALGTQSFERYFGQPVSTPVKIEIATVEAKWIELKDCPVQ
ncbi:MAG: serine/threonine-protein kinase [Bryobacteraceae bacterium]